MIIKDAGEIKNYYDVIISGASFAGLECALHLNRSPFSVLVLERQAAVGLAKTCAGGVMPADLKYLEPSFLNRPFGRVIGHYQKKNAVAGAKQGLISSVERSAVLSAKLAQLKKCSNVTLAIGWAAQKIIDARTVEISGGLKIKCRFLVGADGANSLVRQFLGLASRKIAVVCHYLIPKVFPDFEIYYEVQRFSDGYVWIFPHHDYSSVGCGASLKDLSLRALRHNLEEWLREHKINFSDARFEAAVINCDYQGYRFDNIFLAGDAAGLTSGLTGQGIYPACLSGEQIAREIKGEQGQENLISVWLKQKRRQEFFLKLTQRLLVRQVFYAAIIRILQSNKIKKFFRKYFI